MNKPRISLWIFFIVLIAGMVWVSQWMNTAVEEPERMDIADSPVPPSEQAKLEAEKNAKKATMEFERVVTLDTARGTIEFVLFEQDCPKSAKRIADLVAAGAYNGMKFSRVEGWVIQVEEPARKVPAMGCEFAKGLRNVVGAVGMARKDDRNSNTSVFYIVKIPQVSIDYDYTVFGHIIKGMDLVESIQKDDLIKKASIRPSTKADIQLLQKALQTSKQSS